MQRRPRIGASWSKCLLQQWEIAQHPRAPFSCHTTRRTVRLGRPILAPKAQLRDGQPGAVSRVGMAKHDCSEADKDSRYAAL